MTQPASNAAPRGGSIPLPPCGMYIGNGIYPMSGDNLLSTLVGHQHWTPYTNSPLEMIERIVADNQGNLAQLWGYTRGYAPSMVGEWLYALDEIGVSIPPPNWETGEHLIARECPVLKAHADRYGAGLVRFVREAAKRGLYTLFIYTDATAQWSRQLHDFGEHYLGYDFGERFTFRLDDASLAGKRLEDVTLAELADDLVRSVRAHVEERRAAGWGPIYATSSNFHIDYEILAGTDVPLVEDFAFRHLNLASALSRGLYRQHNLPLWGSHLAHEHYSWIPSQSEEKFQLLRAALYQKYMAGCKMIVNESGNWYVEASLCEDSPKFEYPRVPLSPEEVSWAGASPRKYAPYIAEARRHHPKAGPDSEYCRRYRKEISDFYDYIKAHGTPEGQPETPLAIIKGNYDLCGHTFSPNSAVAGAYRLADINPAWFEGAPEQAWEIVKQVFYPLRNVLGEYPNQFLSGTPLGMVDIISFAGDRIDAAFVSANYRALLFAGWNTASAAQYQLLKGFVRGGGILFVSIPHLSANARRDYNAYAVDELVNGGDFSELCGVRVKGPGERFYWATVPEGSTELGARFPQRFGIMATRLGEIEVTDPAIQTLAIDDERGRPVLLRHRYGLGETYFLNSWAYPGAMNTNEGPGARVGAQGLIGTIYRHIAQRVRGTVWITDDGQRAGEACDHVAWSRFPADGTICLQNVDLKNPRCIHLHQPGGTREILLEAGQFVRLPAPGIGR